MPEAEAQHIIRSIQKKWTLSALLSHFIISVAITLLLVTVLMKFSAMSAWWSIPVLMASFAAIVLFYKNWKVSQSDVTRFLNQQYPQLEESTALLLKPGDSLNLLEKLQVKKIGQAIGAIPASVSFAKSLKRPALVLLTIGLASVALFLTPFNKGFVSGFSSNAANNLKPKPEGLLPNISAVHVTIKSPAYTGIGSRTQSLFNIKAEEGADITWALQTSLPVDSFLLIFDGTKRVPLVDVDGEGKHWSLARKFNSSGFYQVKLDGKLSELYSIELVKDAPPSVLIQKPKSYTIIEYGQPQQVPMTVTIRDDYGIREADISATITQGTGEGVKFTEKKLSFGNFKGGGRSYNLQKTLDLPALGLRPGDELYFFVRSVDNHNQESRSDVYMISIPDTAQLMSMDGLGMGVNLKPEYFRSQRQIIIETEQLLRDQKTITPEAFKEKSNDLGVDQKLLRMRYSKFLGAESEGEGEDEHDHGDEEHGEAEVFGDGQKILDQVSHKHDNAEDATLFDAQTKKQLQEILGEMWNSEARLRTIKTRDALPFQYKALRLLKDLQEKSRSYVAKTSAKTTPLKPEKRLSGDLSKIQQIQTRTEIKNSDGPEDQVRRALGVLEHLKAGGLLDASSMETLQQAAMQLNKRASAEPTIFLQSVGAMNHVLESDGNYSALDLTAAQKGLGRLVKAPQALPSPGTKNPDQGLSKQYFKNLPR